MTGGSLVVARFPTHMSPDETPFCAIVVVELSPGKYVVALPTDAWRGGYFGWEYYGHRGFMPKGQYSGQNHIPINGEAGTSQGQLKESITALVNKFETDLAHKDWVPPKLETLEKRIQSQPYVARPQVVKQDH